MVWMRLRVVSKSMGVLVYPSSRTVSSGGGRVSLGLVRVPHDGGKGDGGGNVGLWS